MKKLRLRAMSILLVLVVCGCANVRSLFVGELREVVVKESPRWFEPNRIALIDVDGLIGMGDGSSFFWRGTSVADVREKLEWAASDRGVRAVVLRINSPGGTVTASDTLYQQLMKFREETGKPVVACLMGMGTSGAYYVAITADHIVANPTTVTGSVGVIMHFINVEGLYGKIGLRSEVIKSGDKKDIGSPTRSLTQEERQILQQVNGALFDRFVGAVRERRPAMTEEDIALVSDGRILTADQALELHMIDGVGYLEDAIAAARSLAGIKAADVVLYRAFPHYNANIYAAQGDVSGLLARGLETLLRQRGPMFLYLWSPGL